MISENALIKLTGKSLDVQTKIYLSFAKNCSLNTYLEIVSALWNKQFSIQDHIHITTRPKLYNQNTTSNQELIDTIDFYGLGFIIDADQDVVLRAINKLEDLYSERFSGAVLEMLLPEWYS